MNIERNSFIRLAELSVYNWGSFQKLHTAVISPCGTLITGDNGSGKSTLVDALVALLQQPSRAYFNIAAAQGDKSDRSLMTYIRGQFGKELDGSGTSNLASRKKGTLTALRALYRSEPSDNSRYGTQLAEDNVEIQSGVEQPATSGESHPPTECTLVVLFWTNQPSNSLQDLKRLYIVADKNITLKEILEDFRDYNTRQLKQRWANDKKVFFSESFEAYRELYSRRLYLENPKAPALLNRALGLKKIDNLTSLIRDLVLEPSEMRERARAAVDEFGALEEIYKELEEARKQRDVLKDLPSMHIGLKACAEDLTRLSEQSIAITTFINKQCHDLWLKRCDIFIEENESLEEKKGAVERQRAATETRERELYLIYQRSGGERLETLKKLVTEKQNELSTISKHREIYQAMAKELDLKPTLDHDGFRLAKKSAEDLYRLLEDEQGKTDDILISQGGEKDKISSKITELKKETLALKESKDSNMSSDFLDLRNRLASIVNCERDDLPFLAELLEVPDDFKLWQGAVERVLGGLRTTLLVEQSKYRFVTKWLNSNHTNLHVRVQVVGQDVRAANFLTDGYLRKLTWRQHKYRDWLKGFLAHRDLHCVDSVDKLNETERSMTREGLVNYGRGRFEKQDRVRVDDRRHWFLGFSNKEKLEILEKDLNELRKKELELNTTLEAIKQSRAIVGSRLNKLEKFSAYTWEQVDNSIVTQELGRLKEELANLQGADKDLYNAQVAWEKAKEELVDLGNVISRIQSELGACGTRLEAARRQAEKAKQLSVAEISEFVAQALQVRIGVLEDKDLEDIPSIEGRHQQKLEEEKDNLRDRQGKLRTRAAAAMSSFKTAWPQLTSEWVTAPEHMDDYLDFLQNLEREGLPSLLDRFRSHMNNDVTQSLAAFRSGIEAEKETIKERIENINSVLKKTAFREGTYLRLRWRPEEFEHVKDFDHKLKLALGQSDEEKNEKRFHDIRVIIEILRKASDPATSSSLESQRLLDARFQLAFHAEEFDAQKEEVLDYLDSSGGKSGGEKESFAGVIVAASLAYALTPTGWDKPAYCSVFLDEAFSNTQEAVSRRVLKVFKELGLHINMITPYKNLNLALDAADSILLVRRDAEKHESTFTTVTWEEVRNHGKLGPAA